MVDRAGQAGSAASGPTTAAERAVEGEVGEAVDVGPQHRGELVGRSVGLPAVGLGGRDEVDELAGTAATPWGW